MTHFSGIVLLAVVAVLLNSGNATSAPTNTEKAKRGNAPQANSREIERKAYDGPLFPAVKDGKYGFIDVTGSFVIPPVFTFADYFSEGMAAVYIGGQAFIDSYTHKGSGTDQFISKENGKWGYIDRTGEIKIAAQFLAAGPFSEGLAQVTVGKGPSEKEFLEVAGPRNPQIPKDELIAYWWKEYGSTKKSGYINVEGLFKIPPQYWHEFNSPFKNGMASVRLAKTLNWLDDGNFVDPSGHVIDSMQGYPRAKEELKSRWIDTSGSEIDNVEALSRLHVNRITFTQNKTVNIYGNDFELEQVGIKDSTGQIIVEAKFERIGDFYQAHLGKAYSVTDVCIGATWRTGGELALAQTFKCGVIDTHGDLVAPLQFEDIHLLSEELAAFPVGCKTRGCSSGKWGLFSLKEQKVTINPQFDGVWHLTEGLIAVRVGNKWGYIDTTGKYVIQPQFSSARAFRDGLAQVGLVDYIDKTGTYVYRGSIGALQPKPMPKRIPAPVAAAKKDATPVSTGTGFVVSSQGHVLTNHHVIEGCQSIRATMDGRMKQVAVVGTDAANDLAVLKLPAPAPSVARFRDGRSIRSGDGVVVVGFPLHGLLASEANVTTGTVSALAGIGNNTRFLQIATPVQQGNSGGPLLDQNGNVVGVVVSKLNALKLAKVTGDIPQNINFAINGVVAKAFLDSQSVEYETSTSSKRLEPAEIGAAAKKFTLLLECYR